MATPRIKICGVTTVADALHAASLGADAVGLNFYPRSPRHVAADTARQIVRALPPFVDPVALFVNETLAVVEGQVSALGAVRTVQWHGDRPEPPPAWAYRYIPAFAVPDAAALEAVRGYLARCRELGRLPAAVLVDGHRPGVYGGTGQVAAWDLLADAGLEVPLILAGGLTPDNVAEAVRRVRPYAVDVAGGVEARPGVKDVDKVRRFVEAVRQAAV
jgi:phosphoribosylanthranilate isomerase